MTSKGTSSLSMEAYFDARKLRRGWKETAGTDEFPGVTRDVFPSSFFFLFFLAGRPLRCEYVKKHL